MSDAVIVDKTDTDSATATDDEKLTVVFGPPVRRTLESLVGVTGKPVSEVLADAITFQEWLASVKRAGETLFVRGSDGALREVTFK